MNAVGTGRYLPANYVAHVYDGHGNHFRYGFTRSTAYLRGLWAALRTGGALLSVRPY